MTSMTDMLSNNDAEFMLNPATVRAAMLSEYDGATCRREVEYLTLVNQEAGVMTNEMWEAHKRAVERLTFAPYEPPTKEEDEPANVVGIERVQLSRSKASYRILNLDITWTSKPQVHAIAAILKAHVKIGDVVDESYILEMLTANEHVLNTRQGAKKVWNYYKGDHADGLTAHGNIERA